MNLALKDACMCIACAEQVLELVSETITVEVRHQFHTKGQTGMTHQYNTTQKITPKCTTYYLKVLLDNLASHHPSQGGAREEA